MSMIKSIIQHLKSPSGIVSLVLSIPVAFAIGLFFSSDPPKSGDPVYTTLDHIQVYSEDSDNTQDKPITVLDTDGNKIESNVHRLRLVFINRGNKGLDGSKFADEIKVKPLHGKILQAKIAAENDRDNTLFNLSTIAKEGEPENEIVEVGFNYWMPTKGVTLEIWHSSMESPEVQVTGSDLDGIVVTEATVEPFGIYDFFDMSLGSALGFGSLFVVPELK